VKQHRSAGHSPALEGRAVWSLADLSIAHCEVDAEKIFLNKNPLINKSYFSGEWLGEATYLNQTHDTFRFTEGTIIYPESDRCGRWWQQCC